MQESQEMLQSMLAVETFAVPNRPEGAQMPVDADNDPEQLLALSPKEWKASSSPVVIVAEQDNEEPEEGPKRAKCIDMERIIMGNELCDIEINYAQYVLKEQFGEVNGLVSALYQDKKFQMIETLVWSKLQIIHCKGRRHWVVVAMLNCQLGEVQVYDSLFQYCDKEIKHTITNLFQFGSAKLKITIAQSQ